MNYYEERLNTFDNYPKQMLPNKYELAKAGCYYTGKADVVTYFRCQIFVRDSERGDNAMNEHTSQRGYQVTGRSARLT